MAQGDIETFYENGEWKNKREGAGRAFGSGYGTKDEAVAVGRDTAKADKVSTSSKTRTDKLPGRTATATTRATSRAR